MHDKAGRTDPASARDDDRRWGELADLALAISREIQFRGYADERAIHLTSSEAQVMHHLWDDPEAPPSRIAAATGMQRTNLSTVLRGLESKGLIERRASPRDGRGVRVHPTERAKLNRRLVWQEWGAATSAAADHDTSDLDAALALLRVVARGLVDARRRTRVPTARP